MGRAGTRRRRGANENPGGWDEGRAPAGHRRGGHVGEAGAGGALPARLAPALGAAALVVGAGLGLGAPGAVAGAATGTQARSITVSTATVAHVGTVLTDAGGLTLYRYTVDPAGAATCTGACAKVWPPLLAAKGSRIRGPRGVSGLSLIAVGDGHWQVALDDHALYRFAGDAKKGQANGQGLQGEWFAASGSAIAPASATTAGKSTPSTTRTTVHVTTTTTSGSGGYGY